MTNQEVIDRALILIGAVASGDSANATESADMLLSLNQMMTMWKQEDKDLQYPPQDTLGDTIPIPMWAEEAVCYNLAVRAATVFDLPVPPDVAFMADKGERFIIKTLLNAKLEQKEMDHLPAGGGRWNILTDSIR